MDSRDRLIVAQVAYKAAVDLHNNSLAVTPRADASIDDIHIVAQDLFDGIFQLAGHVTAAAPTVERLAAAVEETFPGAEPTPPRLTVVAAADEPPYTPDTKSPAEKKANRAWAVAALKADLAAGQFLKNWYDNRESSAGTNRPILKHKATTIGLWDSDIVGINLGG